LVVLCVTLAAAACSSGEDAAEGAGATTAPESNAGSGETEEGETNGAETDQDDPVEEPTDTEVEREPTDPAMVEVESGELIGTVDGPVRTFLAVPYADSPAGEGRWKAPRPHPGWSEPLKANEVGAACTQIGGITSDFVIAEGGSDEDCLTLDVFGPSEAEAAPVMVWFHGGGFTGGTAHSVLYEGTNIADEGVVLVNVNYRLGAFGFLVTDEMVDEGDGPVGNYGLQDQVAALEWVNRNIEQFGGDPDNVTIFGQSAGGFSVCAHLASDRSAGLFHRAIIQSGGDCGRSTPLDTAGPGGEAPATEFGSGWVGASPCADDPSLECLRALSAEEIIATSTEFGEDGFGEVLDGEVLATTALQMAEEDRLPDVEIMTGSNLDEGSLFLLTADVPDAAVLTERVVAAIPDGVDAAEVLTLYQDGFETDKDRLIALQSDLSFGCGAIDFAREAADDTEVFTYYFTRRSPDDPFGVGATHGAELVYVFGNPGGIAGLGEIGEADTTIGDRMRDRWVGFAANGSPGVWTSYDPSDPAILHIDEVDTEETTLNEDRCAALAEIGVR